MADVRQIVLEVLAQLGSSREAKQYLQQFSGVDVNRFAIVKVGGGVLAEDLDGLASALSFLHQLGLYPIVMHGAGQQLDQALADAGVNSRKKDGLRVTDESSMAVIRPVVYRENLRLVNALEKHGARARAIQHGVFQCRYLDREQYGLVGEIERVDLDALRSAVETGAMPIVACLGESQSGQVMNINADSATVALVEAVQPHKIIFLTPTGGLLNADGQVISAVSLINDYEDLMDQPWVHSGMRLKLQLIHDMLDQLPPSASVSITSPGHLTRELFTHTGAGTLVRQGEPIRLLTHGDEVDWPQLKELLEASFGRPLASSWQQGLDLDCVLLPESGRGAAVLTHGLHGIAYLDKFVVTPEARGEGLGAALWQAVLARHQQLYWRSRIGNPINAWYFQQADATLRQGDWIAFNVGVSDQQRAALMADALDRDSGWQEDSS